MLIENAIVGIAAGVALVAGLIANIRNYGIAIGFAYAAIVIVAYILIVWQIWCVLYGSCASTAWWNVFLAVLTFGTLSYYYILNLRDGVAIVALKDQPVIGANPIFKQLNTQIHKYGHVDLLNYTEKVHNKLLSRPSGSGDVKATSSSHSASLSA